MALQKQQVPVSFAGGIDTKTDDKQVLASKLLELENGVFTKKGKIQKRFGNDLLNRSILGEDAEIDSATGIATFKNELVLFNGVKLYSYLEASEAWKEKGSSSSVTVSTKQIVKNNYQQASPDYAYNSGLSCYVWEDSSGGVRYSVLDETTGTIITENSSLSSTGILPRVIGIGRYFFIYYIETTTIKFKYIQTSTPHVISSSLDLTTNVDATDKIYDVQKIGDRVYIAYNTNNVSGSVSIFYQVPSKVVSNEIEFVGEEASDAISICSDQNNNIWLSWYDGSDVKYGIYDYELDNELLSPTSLETVSNVKNIASISTEDDLVTFIYEIDNSGNNFIRKNTGQLDGTIGTAEVFVRSLGLASKFFTYNDQFYITLAHESTLQSTYYVYSLEQDIITKLNTNSGGGYTEKNILPTAVEIEDGKFTIPTLKKGELQAEGTVLYTALGISSSLVDFVSLNNFITAELGNNLHIVGGILQSYDGVTVTESGFNVFPEGLSYSEVDDGVGEIANGNYQYIAVYAWYDNQGQLHRSGTSIALDAVVASGPSNVELTIPTLRISKKENVFIEVYRTESNGEIFYKVTSNTSLLLNDPTVDTITFTDDTPDADLLSGELLYTTGGVLDNIAPPSSSVIVNWKNRIALKSSDEPNTVLVSKIRNENSPVEFSDALKIVVDQEGGDITALGVLDGKLIIFKKNKIFFQAGDGPNNLGEQSDWGLPQDIKADAGCIDVNSVVDTPNGLMFKSEKGIYLLDRSLQVSYLGFEVELYNSNRITSAELVADQNQVRFTTEEDKCLVYDYFFNQWSTFTGYESVGACNFQNKFTFVKSDGRVFQENSSVFTDAAQYVPLKLVSSWIQLGDISGFQRIYKLLLLGEFKSAHRLKVKMGYDFNTNFTQEVEIDATAVMNLTAYGEDSPYGSGTPYGGKFPLYQWRIFPKRQKCQAFRISIEDIMDDVFGESFTISNMRFEIGVKQGSNKLATDKSAGTS